jgi:tetratricopeptide (TPR) repeat protein
MGIVIAAVVLGLPALAFTVWPLLRRDGGAAPLLALPPDEREQWLEAKGAALRALRELAFEHDAGHISDADYAELRARYEGEAAAALTALDRLGPAATTAPVSRAPRADAAPHGWRHPIALGASGVALLVFGLLLGVGIVRYTEPDRTAAMPPVMPPMTAAPDATAGAAAPRSVSPDVMRGMLQAARGSLSEGRYSEAIAAYQAVLKRDPKNVDAMTHLGFIVAIGGHADSALETFDKALAIDPDYAPALLYRGQVLYEAKKDVAGAVSSWERFVKVAPNAEDRERVKKLIAEAKAGSGPR